MTSHPLSVLVLSAFTLNLAGCAARDAVTGLSKPRIVEKIRPDGLLLEEIDLEPDGRPDVFNTLRPRTDAEPLLIKKEADSNRDGRIDMISEYDEEGALVRENLDRDFDGRFDAIDHFQASVRVMSESDADRDGKMDTFSYFENQRLVRREIDSNGDGRIDIWERYNSDGRLFRRGLDTDFDGKLDERE